MHITCGFYQMQSSRMCNSIVRADGEDILLCVALLLPSGHRAPCEVNLVLLETYNRRTGPLNHNIYSSTKSDQFFASKIVRVQPNFKRLAIFLMISYFRKVLVKKRKKELRF